MATRLASIVCALLVAGDAGARRGLRRRRSGQRRAARPERLLSLPAAGLQVGGQPTLNAETAAAKRAGFPIKVALIASPVDLGVIPDLFGKPQQYADFLDQEISFQGKQPLLVVMAAGYGVAGSDRPGEARRGRRSSPRRQDQQRPRHTPRSRGGQARRRLGAHAHRRTRRARLGASGGGSSSSHADRGRARGRGGPGGGGADRAPTRATRAAGSPPALTPPRLAPPGPISPRRRASPERGIVHFCVAIGQGQPRGSAPQNRLSPSGGGRPAAPAARTRPYGRPARPEPARPAAA